jgi:hypothetical protein
MADEAAVILLGLLEIRRYSCCWRYHRRYATRARERRDVLTGERGSVVQFESKPDSCLHDTNVHNRATPVPMDIWRRWRPQVFNEDLRLNRIDLTDVLHPTTTIWATR